MNRSSATASTSRVLAPLGGAYIVQGRKTEEIEALTEKRCVEVGTINAASDVVEWVYALRLEVKVSETRSGSGAGVSRPTTVACLCGGVQQREIVMSVEPKRIRDRTHLETNHNEALDRYAVYTVPSPPPGLLHPSAVICHGPYALLPTKYAPNSNGFAYEGYKLTSWSDAEEQLVEKIEGGEIPVKVESALAAEGAEVVSTTDNKLLGSVTVGREVLSASNPTAANTLGSKFVETLQAS